MVYKHPQKYHVVFLLSSSLDTQCIFVVRSRTGKSDSDFLLLRNIAGCNLHPCSFIQDHTGCTRINTHVDTNSRAVFYTSTGIFRLYPSQRSE